MATTTYTISDLAKEFDLTTRAMRFYEDMGLLRPERTGPQLKKFLAILAQHRKQLEEQMADLQANLEEVKAHEREARALLAKTEKARQA